MINFNMGCIETLANEFTFETPNMINFNMGCIETALHGLQIHPEND